jgi:uncharacterized protein (DUF1684 family)
MKISVIILITTLIATGCNRNNPLVEDWDAYTDNHKEWQESRLERLKSENGWVNLAGLFWLEEGVNSFGSDPSNDIIFPEGFPGFGGQFILEDSMVMLNADPAAGIMVNGERVTGIPLNSDEQANTTNMEQGEFRWFIVKRGEQFGIRLRDLGHPRLAELDHIPSYPFKKEWVVRAELKMFDSVKTIEVPTVIPGYSEFYKAPGELVFRINGRNQTLIPFTSGNGYFIIVGDATNGLETYGAGRFLYTDRVDGNQVIIDFNRAYNPPCAFSPFATCPLPPPENILDIEIDAGEKAVHLD